MPSATIVGAGVFGAWTAKALRDRGWRVTLLEQYGPANSRASSGGETRIIRAGYGALQLYAAWARQSLPEWTALERLAGERLFVPTGALFVARDAGWLSQTMKALGAESVAAERLSASELASRYPQLRFGNDAEAVFEPGAGVLFARRAVQALVRALAASGVEVRTERAEPSSLIAHRSTDALIFAAGPWLPRLFPDLLGTFIVPTRQEVCFFGAPPGALAFSAGQLPAWVAFDEGIYGLPDLEHRGVKVAIDAHGPAVDPDSLDRAVAAQDVERIRAVVRRHLPALANAPLLESRVCQYENTPDGHLLLDRLPGEEGVWIAGGGSGHGFKHGPAIGRYMADLIESQGVAHPEFALEGRPPRRRAVY